MCLRTRRGWSRILSVAGGGVSVLAWGLIGIGTLFVFTNWAVLLSPLWSKKRRGSFVPIGGLFLPAGLLLVPSLRTYAIFGLLLDIGSWVLLFTIPALAKEALRSAPWRRVSQLLGQWDEITFLLSLYRPDYYIVKLTKKLPPNTAGWIERGSLGRWVKTEKGISLVSYADSETLPAKAFLTELPDKKRHFIVTSSTYSSSNDKYSAPEFPPVDTLLKEVSP